MARWRVVAAVAAVALGVDALHGVAWASSTIDTVAGTGVAGAAGDGGPATSAQLSAPAGVAVDAAGDFFVADYGNHRVRKVDASGVITTVAGTGVAGSKGDGGPATSARLDTPTDVVVDGTGNVFIADFGNHKVRKVSPSGTISTVAGTGVAGSSGDGGQATAAKLTSPAGLDLDPAGSLLIADYGANRVRKVDASGVITTVAGTGVAGATGATGDGGPAVGAALNAPGDVVGHAGSVYVADSHSNRVRKVDSSGVITTVAGTGVAGYSGDGGPAASAQLNDPVGIAVDAGGNLFVAELGSSVIRKVDPSGTITSVAGTGVAGYSGDTGSADAAQLAMPSRVNLSTGGDFFVSDLGNHRIRKVSSLGSPAAVPGAPTSVVADAGDGEATVSWSAPLSDGGSALTGYTVTSSAGGTVVVSGVATSTTVGGLTNGVAHTFTVAATNAVGTGPTSAASAAVTPSPGPPVVPGAPSGVNATAGDGDATVSWSPPSSDGGSAVTGYTVVSSGGQQVSVAGSSTVATVPGLVNGVAYTFTVTATNAAGTGPSSVPSSAVTPQPAPVVPDAPGGVGASAGDGAATVTWSAPPSDGGSAVTGYTVASSDGRTSAVSALATSATVGGLMNGVAYTFTVAATNAVGTGPASAPSVAVTPHGLAAGVTSTAGTRSASTPDVAVADAPSPPPPTTTTTVGPSIAPAPAPPTTVVVAAPMVSTTTTIPTTTTAAAAVRNKVASTPSVAPRVAARVSPTTTVVPPDAATAAAPAQPTAKAGADMDAHAESRSMRVRPGPLTGAAKLQRLAIVTAKGSAFPLSLALVVVLFLLVQDRIDRRDPKLALAPVYSAPLLDFGASPSGGAGT
jgi:hypothetical protein